MKPSYRILVSGNDITADVTARNGLVEWGDSVREAADPFSITLEDTDNGLAIPKAGSSVEISAGYDGALSRIGTFTVDRTVVEGPPDLLNVSGSSAPFVGGNSSAAARKSFTWENTTLGDIAKKIASGLSLKPAIDPALASKAVTNEQQTNESDSNFLLRLARRHGGYVKFTDGRLVLAKEGSGVGVGGTALNVTINKSQVTRWRVEAGGKKQAYTRVKTRSHDYSTATTTEKVAEIPKPKSIGQFGASQAGTGTFTPVDFDGPNPFAGGAIAADSAKVTASRIARASRVLTITMPGMLNIVAGGKITLVGFRDGVAGEWLVVSVRHRIQPGSGWVMEIECEGVN